MPVDALHPTLIATMADAGVTAGTLGLIPVAETRDSSTGPREDLLLTAEGKQAVWRVPSLASLFRGNVAPPPMRDYPDDYVPVFALFERNVVTLSQAGRAPTDGELEDLYGSLRRRPDGRSSGWAHDGVWRIAAFTLGHFALSAAEFEAVAARLARAARFWRAGPSSRYYLGELRKRFPERVTA